MVVECLEQDIEWERPTVNMKQVNVTAICVALAASLAMMSGPAMAEKLSVSFADSS